MQIKVEGDQDRLIFRFTATVRTIYPRWMGMIGFPMYHQQEKILSIANLPQIRLILEALHDHRDFHIPIYHPYKTALYISKRDEMTHLVFEYPDYTAYTTMDEQDTRKSVDVVVAVIESLTEKKAEINRPFP